MGFSEHILLCGKLLVLKVRSKRNLVSGCWRPWDKALHCTPQTGGGQQRALAPPTLAISKWREECVAAEWYWEPVQEIRYSWVDLLMGVTPSWGQPLLLP